MVRCDIRHGGVMWNYSCKLWWGYVEKCRMWNVWCAVK